MRGPAPGRPSRRPRRLATGCWPRPGPSATGWRRWRCASEDDASWIGLTPGPRGHWALLRWGWISTGGSRGSPCSWPTWARSPRRRATPPGARGVDGPAAPGGAGSVLDPVDRRLRRLGRDHLHADAPGAPVGRAGAAGRGRGDRRPAPGPDRAGRAVDIIAGAAGCIGGLLGLQRCVPPIARSAAAIRCGDRLLARAQPMTQGIGWLPKAAERGRWPGSRTAPPGSPGRCWSWPPDRRGALPDGGARGHRVRADPLLRRGGQLARPARAEDRTPASDMASSAA